MTNIFLKVNKDLFKLGLAPIDILVLAQVLEFNTNTGDCYITDKALADAFGVSEKTISRSMKKLDEELHFITRDTKNVQKGKERHIKINFPIIEAKLKESTKDKMSLVESDTSNLTTDKLSLAEQTNCPLRNRQNDLIKDNKKDNKKDNFDKFIF